MLWARDHSFRLHQLGHELSRRSSMKEIAMKKANPKNPVMVVAGVALLGGNSLQGGKMKSRMEQPPWQEPKEFGRFLTLGIFFLMAFGLSSAAADAAQQSDRSAVTGMATLSGKVDAPKPFKAAQVYILN